MHTNTHTHTYTQAAPTSALRYVRDNTGDLAARTSLVQRERSQLCEALMYAVFVAKVTAMVAVLGNAPEKGPPGSTSSLQGGGGYLFFTAL